MKRREEEEEEDSSQVKFTSFARVLCDDETPEAAPKVAKNVCATREAAGGESWNG